jgi:hypothetical protein
MLKLSYPHAIGWLISKRQMLSRLALGYFLVLFLLVCSGSPGLCASIREEYDFNKLQIARQCKHLQKLEEKNFSESRVVKRYSDKVSYVQVKENEFNLNVGESIPTCRMSSPFLSSRSGSYSSSKVMCILLITTLLSPGIMAETGREWCTKSGVGKPIDCYRDCSHYSESLIHPLSSIQYDEMSEWFEVNKMETESSACGKAGRKQRIKEEEIFKDGYDKIYKAVFPVPHVSLKSPASHHVSLKSEETSSYTALDVLNYGCYGMSFTSLVFPAMSIPSKICFFAHGTFLVAEGVSSGFTEKGFDYRMVDYADVGWGLFEASTNGFSLFVDLKDINSDSLQKILDSKKTIIDGMQDGKEKIKLVQEWTQGTKDLGDIKEKIKTLRRFDWIHNAKKKSDEKVVSRIGQMTEHLQTDEGKGAAIRVLKKWDLQM